MQSSIRGELRPQVDALRERLVRYTVALERAKAKEMVRYFSEVLNDQLLKLHNEDGDLALNFDVRAKIREELQKPMEKLLTEILEKCKYENYVGSRFDEDLCDVVVNGSEKMTQGQGFRAFLNTVVALAVQELMNQFNLHKTHLLVMDSPILSLKERGEDKVNEGSIALADASFSLYTEEEYAKEESERTAMQSNLNSGDGTTTPLGDIDMGNLTIGKYYLIETQAPAGYILLDRPVIVTVESTRVYATLGSDPTAANIAEWDASGAYWKITVHNNPGVSLPNTGGPGTNFIYFPGTILTALAGAGLVMRRKRKAA